MLTLIQGRLATHTCGTMLEQAPLRFVYTLAEHGQLKL